MKKMDRFLLEGSFPIIIPSIFFMHRKLDGLKTPTPGNAIGNDFDYQIAFFQNYWSDFFVNISTGCSSHRNIIKNCIFDVVPCMEYLIRRNCQSTISDDFSIFKLVFPNSISTCGNFLNTHFFDTDPGV